MNSYIGTEKDIECLNCRKKFERLIQTLYREKIENYCWGCFHERLPNIFLIIDDDHILIRGIIDINFHQKKSTKKYERNKMNNSLRYFILNRDGFKCVACGNTAQDSKLQVDHIKPISRGGKTTEDNLQTLCFICNSGKGASEN